jgi:hypothetical protein
MEASDGRAAWRRGPRGQPHFCLATERLCGPPPVGGTFWFQIFIQAPSPEIWRKTISGGEEVLARKWGGLFWATSLEKIFGGVTAIISFRPGGWIQQSAVPRCAILSMGSTGVTSSEAARVHIAHHHRSRVAARGARAAAGDAGDRVPQRCLACRMDTFLDRIPQRSQRQRIYRGPECSHRIPLGRGSIRSPGRAKAPVEIFPPGPS